MCYFFTLAIPAAHSDHLRDLIPREIHLAAVTDGPLAEDTPSGCELFLLLQGGCSCGMYQREALQLGVDVERRRKQYAAAGWSPAKIERALRQAAESRVHSPPANDFRGFRPDIRQLLAQLVARTPRVAVRIHWDGARDEPFVVGPAQRVTIANLADFTPDEDCWVWILAK